MEGLKETSGCTSCCPPTTSICPAPPPFPRKDIMDKEWRRRQTLVGRFQYPHHNAYTMDERLAGFGPETL